jgi:hypothetical protein
MHYEFPARDVYGLVPVSQSDHFKLAEATPDDLRAFRSIWGW